MAKQTKLILGAVVLIILVAGLTFALLRQPGTQTSPATIRMGSFSVAIDYSPYLVAKEKGWFEEELKDNGITVEYTTFQSLPPINESFATDRIDVVFEAEVPAIVGRASGADIRIAGLSATLRSQDLIVSPTSQAQSIVDLKGQKVAVLAGTGFHYALLNSIEKAGLTRDDFTIIDMMPPDAKAAFQTGTIDAWAVWPPFPEQELVAGTARPLPGLDAEVQVIMAVRGAFADQNPQLLEQIVQVLHRAKKWVQDNPREAQQIVSKQLDLPLNVVELAWSKNDWDADLTSEVIADMQAKADFLMAEGFVKSGVDVKRQMIQPLTISTAPSP